MTYIVESQVLAGEGNRFVGVVLQHSRSFDRYQESLGHDGEELIDVARLYSMSEPAI